jgi:purine-nucleoside phosphorylase
MPLPVYSTIKETVDYILAQCQLRPVLGLILGSGLGSFIDSFQNRTAFPFSDLPHFPVCTAPGHAGNLVYGTVEGVPVAALQGRVHLYEGYAPAEVAFPVRVLGSLGICKLIVTNAAGGINPLFNPGDLMIIADHINMTGTNPLIGPNEDDFGPRFPDMSQAYDPDMRAAARTVALNKGMTVREGVYVGVHGPNYETPAEIRMFHTLGGDAVGMSTIPEVIAANQIGMRVLGLSCITNKAAGILPVKLTHEEVMETAAKASDKFRSLLLGLVPRLAADPL